MQQLLNPFAQKYPDSNEGSFPAEAVSIKFNPSGPYAGHYLAAGNYDGTVNIWDVETRGIARTLRGHSKSISGLSWSRNNRYLLTSSLDGSCIIWDLSVMPHTSLRPTNPLNTSSSKRASTSTQLVARIRLGTPVSNAQFHPLSSNIILVTLTSNEVVIIDRRPGGGMNILVDRMESEVEINGEENEDQDEHTRGNMSSAAFSPCGSRIYAGTNKGKMLIIDPKTRYVIKRIPVANSAIRQMSFDALGRHLLTSANDRAIRLLTVSPISGDLKASHRFQDSVNRTPWHAIGFNPDSEYVMGGAGHKAAHTIFIWDRESGVLVKVLEEPKESLGDCEWHPTRPIIASVTTSGDILIWHTTTPDNWAAFAPGFEELEENVEYDEREDEFDIEDETELNRRKDLEEDIDVDILRVEDSFLRRPHPIMTLPPSLSQINSIQPNGEQDVETFEEKAVRLAADVHQWAIGEEGIGGDGDTWEGFYISLDLLTPGPKVDV